MTPSLLFWLAAAVALLAAEGLTVNLVSIWFAVGAVGGLAASWLGASLLVQFAVFALVSFVCLLVTRPLVRRLRPAAPKGLDADGNLGRTGLVLTPIRPGCEGRVRVDGVDWRAACSTPLEAGARCRVTAVGATTLTVEHSDRPERIDLLVELLTPYKIKEVARTGTVALEKGSGTIGYKSK